MLICYGYTRGISSFVSSQIPIHCEVRVEIVRSASYGFQLLDIRVRQIPM